MTTERITFEIRQTWVSPLAQKGLIRGPLLTIVRTGLGCWPKSFLLSHPIMVSHSYFSSSEQKPNVFFSKHLKESTLSVSALSSTKRGLLPRKAKRWERVCSIWGMERATTVPAYCDEAQTQSQRMSSVSQEVPDGQKSSSFASVVWTFTHEPHCY